MKTLARWILKLWGWKCLPLPGDKPRRSIICVAPHTSNIDFIVGKLYYLTVGKPHGFLMKQDWFFFPLGGLLRAMGGIPVSRGAKGDMVSRLASYIRAQPDIHIAITPEGTRSYTTGWRTGFYRMAIEADIPIELAVIDYQKREVGIFEVFYPTGNMAEDIDYMRSRFRGDQAKYPHKFQDHVPR